MPGCRTGWRALGHPGLRRSAHPHRSAGPNAPITPGPEHSRPAAESATKDRGVRPRRAARQPHEHASEPLRGRYPEQAKAIGQDDPGGLIEPEPGAVQVGDLLGGLTRADPAVVIPLVVATGEIFEITRHSMRLEQSGRLGDGPWEVTQDRQERRLGWVGE